MQKIIDQKITWKASDGTTFDNQEECAKYEKNNTEAPPEFIELYTFIHLPEWTVVEKLAAMGYVFDDKINGNLKYALTEEKVKVRVNTKTGICEILEINNIPLLR